MADEIAGDPGAIGYRRGTHRLVAPAATLGRLRPHLATLGITRLAVVTGLDRIGLPVVMAVRPNARSVAVAQGKGLDLDAAKASAAMEAMETWHAERVRLPLRLARHADLTREAEVADPALLPRPPGSRYAEDVPILWVEGRDIVAERPLWVPHELVHADYTLPRPAGSGCFAATTNGLASGNHRLEAICHGLAEVIERDAVALWHGLPRRERLARLLDLGSVDDPSCRLVLDRLARTGFEVGVWDATSDLGVATFVCMFTDARDPSGHVGVGFGCHPARGIALLRALLEAAQTRLTYVAGSRDDIPVAEYGAAARDARNASVARMMAGPPGERSFAHVPSLEADELAGDLGWMIERLLARGLDRIAVVDLTDPAIGLPVVRVVVPGLEGPEDAALPGIRARGIGAAR